MSELYFYVTGSSGSPSDDNPLTVARSEDAISFLVRLIPQPLQEDELTKEEQEIIPNLLRLGLVAKRDDMIHLQFPCFTSEDYEFMKHSIQSVAISIVAALREVWSEIHELVKQIDSDSHIPVEEKMYLILGCMILDWLSLGWLSDHEIIHYRKKQANGEKFLLQGITYETRARNFSRFCYSATSGTDELNYTVFGQATKSRMVTPEIEMRSWATIYNNFDKPKELALSIASFSQIASFRFLNTIVDILCSEKSTRESVGRKLNLQQNEIEAIEQYLIDGGIITIKDDEWIPKTIILTSDDEVPLQRLNSLTEEIIVKSMQNQISILEKEYKGTTSERHDVPFEEALTDIWHDIFSEIIRIFIADGDMVPMYENEGCAYSNFIWKRKIIEFPF